MKKKIIKEILDKGDFPLGSVQADEFIDYIHTLLNCDALTSWGRMGSFNKELVKATKSFNDYRDKYYAEEFD